MIDYTEELENIERELLRIEKEISFCMYPDVKHLSWEPMRDKRLKRRAEIQHIIEHEILFI